MKDFMTAARRYAESKAGPSLQRAVVTLSRPDPWPAITQNSPNRLFIHIPRTAGGTVKAALQLPRTGHIPLYVYAHKNPQAFAQITSFAFVRDPWDRMVSAWSRVLNTAQNPLTEQWGERNLKALPDFASFVRKLDNARFCRHVLAYPHFRPQAEFLELNGKVAVSQIGRFENLADDVRLIQGMLGLSPSPLDHEHRSPHKDFRSCYDRETAEIIGRVYARDVQLFGYRSPFASGD